jgi:hypothetical protein
MQKSVLGFEADIPFDVNFELEKCGSVMDRLALRGSAMSAFAIAFRGTADISLCTAHEAIGGHCVPCSSTSRRVRTQSLRFRLQVVYQRPSGCHEPVSRLRYAIIVNSRVHLVGCP